MLVIPDGVAEPTVRVVRDLSGSAANAGASTQSFNQGFGGFPHGGGFGSSGSAANAGKKTVKQKLEHARV